MAQQLDAKPRVDHIELTDTNDVLKEEYDTIQLKSDQDQLSWAKTLWKFRKAVFICNLICMAGACDGYQINLNGSIIANAGFTRKIGFLRADGRYALNAKHTATWGGLQSGGQAISFMFIHPISDRLGRKYTLYLMWLILMAALLIETFVQTWQQWAGAKLLAGMGIGALQMTLPVYIAEFSPVNIRGSMVLAYGIWNNIGNFLAPVVLLASERKDRFDYQTPIRTQWAFLGISLFVLLYLPETPSYYAARGQHEKGKASLRRVFGGVPGYDIEHEYNITVQTLEQERTLAAENAVRGWKDLLQSYADCFRGSNLRRTFGAPMSFILQQLTGLSFLNIYAALFFRQAGFAKPFDITAILTAIKICGILTCIVLADNIGRRRLILFAGVWCTLMMFVVGAAGQKATTEPIKNLVIAAACFWSVANSPLGSLGYTLVGEVPPQRLRARMSGVANTFSTITGIIFNTTMPIMLDVNGRNLGYNTAWVFAGLGSIACVAAYFLVPETARRNSAELDELYEKRIPCRKMRQYVTDVQREQNTRLGLSGGVAHSVLA